MSTGRIPAETRLDLQGTEEQEETLLWVPPLGIHPDRHNAKGLLQEVVEVEELAQEGDSGSFSVSTHRDAQPLLKDRDPRGINKCLKVMFEDMIAEPRSVRSFDKVWLWSHALFEVSRLWCYRLISVLFAVPVSLLAGIFFAVLSCIHIWLIMPCLQLFLINMHWVLTAWGSVLNIVFAPLCKSISKCCGNINVLLTKD
uniref:Caveolin n=1 Tax=Esox lucius TaxID=8010 RepID=A0A3P8YRI2_ESOLU